MKKILNLIGAITCLIFLNYIFIYAQAALGQPSDNIEEIQGEERVIEALPLQAELEQADKQDLLDGSQDTESSGALETVIYQQESAGSINPGLSKYDTRTDKISLDLKGLDIVDVLKMISARSGINIVVGKNVTGRATLFLKDVSIWDAFEIIIAANNLAYEKKDNIINVMTDRDYELIYGEKFDDKKELLTKTLKYARAQDLSITLNQIKSNIGRVVIDEATNTIVVLDTPVKIKQIDELIDELDKPTETRVFELRYAQADKIGPKIQEAVSKGVGAVKTDERTNKIAITDYPHKIAEIAKIIVAFDEKTRQVRIDAQIIEISPEKDEFKMGVDWDAWINKNFRFANSLPLGGATKLSFGLATGSIALGEKYDKKGVIDLLRTIGKTRILSSPSIMALNNQEAKILVGTKEAYVTSSTSQSGTGTQVTAQTVNFVDVGIKLYVTPTINQDGFVTMKIKPEVSSSKLTDLTSEGKVTQVPIVTTSEAETVITLKDGATIVIAGLKKDKKENEIKKIPLLGDIPFLGIFFRSVSATLNKTELVIFLTPHIVSDDNPPRYTNLIEDEYIQKLSRMSERRSVSEKRPTVKIGKPAIATETPMLQDPKASGPSTYTNDYNEYIRNKIMSVISTMNVDPKLKGKALVSFVVSSNGQLLGEPEIVSSTLEGLKEPIVKAIKLVPSFAGFPKDLQKPEQRFQLEILYE